MCKTKQKPRFMIYLMWFMIYLMWFMIYLVRVLDLWLKRASWNPGTSGEIIFFSRVNFVCWLLFGVHSTPMLPQWHIKDPGHSAESAGNWLHLNMHTPVTQWSWNGLTIPLSRHSMGTYQETSLHTTHEGALGHSPLSLLSHCGLILT